MHLLRILLKVVKVLVKMLFRVAAVLGLLVFVTFVVLLFVLSSPRVDPAMAKLVYSGVADGKIAYGVTTPQQLEELLGYCVFRTWVEALEDKKLYLDYPGGVHAVFVQRKGGSFPLLWLTLGGTNLQIGNRFRETFGGRYVDIGFRRPRLSSVEDINKLDSFNGLKGASLVKLDLRGYKDVLENMRFDSRTQWPEPNKMPEAFDPCDLLEEGKNPGLGIRGLHKQGIDGRGVRIAIIDQPLLRNHQEYAGKIIRYETEGLMTRFFSPQMHGAPVTSIAVGKTCGVAPAAKVFYFAMPMWKMDNRPYCDILDQIIKLNGGLNISERIRVVSISTGMFPNQTYFDRWKETLAKANEHGILVVTCDPAFLKYGTLERIPNKNADDPSSYKVGKYGGKSAVLQVPAGHRTTASYEGPQVYTYWTDGGMSWAAPYLAGLAALAYQVDPEIKPDEIIKLWLETAVRTDAGPVVNPPGFIEAVQKGKLK
jgi:subtilisin family serine protease